MHRIDSASGRILSDEDRQQRSDVARWRKSERERLISIRSTIPIEERREYANSIATWLDRALGDLSGKIVSAYWPFRGEPDLRPWMERLTARGVACALPVVVQPRAPLVFRIWREGTLLRPGVWNIPVPAGGPAVIPDIVLAPVVGFDRACYRLGHGGGFFDRTLAALPLKPRVLGVGYERLRISTIYPQAHDVVMDGIVTEAGIMNPAAQRP